jgi:hypothetical protein
MESQWNHIIRRTRRRVIRGISLALQYAIMSLCVFHRAALDFVGG